MGSSVQLNLVNQYPLEHFEDIEISDGYLYNTYDFFDIYDVSNPNAITLVNQYPLEDFEDIEISDGYAYMITHDGILYIYDVSNPNDIKYVNQHPLGESEDIEVSDGYLYNSVDWATLDIYDVSNPNAITFVNQYSLERIEDIEISDGYAYVITWDGLYIYDISNPNAIALVNQYSLSGVTDIEVSDGYIYGNYGWDYLNIYDVSNPNDIKYVNQYPQEHLEDIEVSDGYAYLITIDGTVYIYDVSIQIDTSNIIWDSGLEPDLDGYRFINFDQNSIPWDLFKQSFNAQKVETILGIPKEIPAAYYLTLVRGLADGGSCFGMSSSSLILNENNINIRDFYYKESVLTQPSLFMNLPILSDYILYYHIRQTSAPCLIERAETMNDFDDVYSTLKSTSSKSYWNDPLIFDVYWKDTTNKKIGHTVVPLRFIEYPAQNIGELYCYDSNKPNKEVIFTFNKKTKTVSCLLYNNNNALEPSLVHLSSAKSNGKIPDVLDVARMVIAPIDFPKLQYIDSTGNRLGYVNGEFVDEIQGACQIVPLGNTTENLLDTYYLGNISVTRKIIGTAKGNFSFSTFKPDTFIELNFSIENGTIDTLLIPPNATSIEFISDNGTQFYNVTFVKGTENYERLVNIDEFFVESNSGFNLSISEDLEEICIINNGSTNQYNLTIKQFGTNPASSTQLSISIESGTNCFIKPDDWSSLDDTIFFVEHDIGNDGTIDYTEQVSSNNLVPSIDIEKYTNGFDMDKDATPSISIGESVTWKYIITNDGNVALTNIYLFDDKEGTIACPKDSLNPGEYMECSWEGTAKLGHYINIANVTGEFNGITVNDSDSGEYYGFEQSSSEIREFPTIALPMIAIVGLAMFFKRKE